jgi:putative addiction module component (TIGR02574 family)
MRLQISRWESLEADGISLTEAHRRELDHRLAEHERNPDEVLSWEQVTASLFQKPWRAD